jgi:hypothetical protein
LHFFKSSLGALKKKQMMNKNYSYARSLFTIIIIKKKMLGGEQIEIQAHSLQSLASPALDPIHTSQKRYFPHAVFKTAHQRRYRN